MRPLAVINCQPLFGEELNLLHSAEEVLIQHFVAVGAIEALDEGVLIGLAGLDVEQRNATLPARLHKAAGDELRTIVQAQRLRLAVELDDAIENANNSCARDTAAHCSSVPLIYSGPLSQ